MRLRPKIISAVSLTLAGVGSLLAAMFAADFIEERSGHAVEIALIEAGHDWADVNTDGLQVHVGGIAPTEAERFNALHIAGTVVEASRVVDGTSVQPSEPLTPPQYSIEILRNDEGITLAGLVPDTLDRAAMAGEIAALAQGAEVTDLLQDAAYPAPTSWEAAVQQGLNALARLPRSKVSISPGKVQITAISNSEEEKADLEKVLLRRVPASVEMKLDISAPRPVITPFTLRFLIDEAGPRFDACSADTPRSREIILAAAARAGLGDGTDCTLGLGVPSTEWATAVGQGIDAIADLGGGSISFSDADVTLIAPETAAQADFDRVVGELESNLPEVFSLHSVLPQPPEDKGKAEGSGPPEFVATRSPEGQVQLRGRLNNDLIRDTVESFAKARFGVNSVYTASRIDDSLPDGWPVRVLAGLQALAELDSGAAVVHEDFIDLRGKSGSKEAQAAVARILGEKLGEGQNYTIDVTYDEALDPVVVLPTPDECVDRIDALLTENKITFDPGSADISGSAVGVVNDIADTLKDCAEVEMYIEIAGHTDSQGREEMNLELSQSRAQAVLDALMARRVLVSKIRAKGYGETEPIADNETEEGREENRRIEFRLLDDPTEQTVSDEATDEVEATEEGADVEPAESEDSSETEPAQDGDAAVPEAEVDATTGAAEDTAPQDPAESDGQADEQTEENQ